MPSSHHNYTILICFLLLFSSCVGTSYLKNDEKLLYKQRIKGADKIDEDELEELFVQEVNNKIPLIPFSPYVLFYQIGLNNFKPEVYRDNIEEIKSKYDRKIADTENPGKARKLQSKKLKNIQRQERKIEEGNTLMRWGEPLSIYDTANIRKTADYMEFYLQSKGFFKGEVEVSEKFSGKKVKITYHINEGKPYLIDSVFYNIPDAEVAKLMELRQVESLIVTGKNYDQDVLTRERERITNLLKNNGYFAFSRGLIDFDVDTAFHGSHKVAVRTTINNPPGQDRHKVFNVDSIIFVADAAYDSRPDSSRNTETYKGITFRAFDLLYNPKIVSRRIFIKKDRKYSREATLNTQRQLANLDNFRFINVTYDSTGEDFIANIFVSPLNRYQWSNEFGINVTQGFPGPFYNLSFKKRNVFRGLENFDITARVGIEGVAPVSKVNDDFYRSTEAGINASLTFPQFILPINSELKERLGQINPKTRLTGGFSYTSRPEYNRKNTNFASIYSWENGRDILYSITATDLSLINSNLDSAFRQRLVNLKQNLGNNLINSFNPSFVSSMRFTVSVNHNDYGFGLNNSSFFRLFLESGGTTLNFIDTSIFNENSETGRGKLEYYKFLKFAGDYRKLKPVTSSSSLAYRINVGVAVPYSQNEVLPYEKYFFAGGSSGIRAWRPRRLGPGSYAQIDTSGVSPVISYDFEQQGEILFEGSLEWRQDLIGFIEYAWFVDFGNIWTVHEDASRKGAKFEIDRFWREIAIGSGLGLRFDFSFLILRLDAGVKIHDPARPEGKRFIFNEGFYDAPFIKSEAETLVFNIGIGYPF